MAFNYTPLANSAVRLIGKFGKTVVLSRPSQTIADSSKPWRGPTGAAETVSPKGVVTDWTADELKDERIRADDIKLLVAAQDSALGTFDPMHDAFCQMDGVTYGTKSVGKLEPGTVPLLYTLRLRK